MHLGKTGAAWTTFIQWKGTDLCMDFNCPDCGEHSHFDGMFAYAIQCPFCEAFFEMPSDVPLKKLDAKPDMFLAALSDEQEE